MTVKNILLSLLLAATGLSVFAQLPPPVANSGDTNRDEILRRALEQHYARLTNPPVAAPASASEAAPVLATNPPPALRPSRVPPRLPIGAQRAGIAVTNPPPAPGSAAAPGAIPSRPKPASVVPEPGAVLVQTAPPATTAKAGDLDEVLPPHSINWASAPLEKVMEIYAEFVGRNLLRPEKLPDAKIVLQQTTPLTRREIIHAIEAALALNQISVVNVGDKFVTVTSTPEAYKIPGRINTNEVAELAELGSIVTHIVQLKYTKPSELQSVLHPFASGAGASPILPIDGSGMLVLRDNVANVKRMLEMIEKVDVTAPSEFLSEVIPIKYAKAEEIASALSSIGGGTGGTVGTRPTSTGSAIAGGASRFGQPGYNPAQPGQPGTPGAIPTPSSTSSFSDRLQNIIRKAAGSGDIQLLGTTKIIADIRSNSLLVFATRQDMETIKDIISKLDVVLAQVLIETIIMDVSLSDKWALGISAAQTPRKFSGDFSGAGGMNMSRFSQILNSTATNAFSDLVGEGLRYFGKVNDDIYLQVEAAASDGRVNVIQRPRIQTSHATPASLFIGSTVPVISGTYYGGGFSGGPSSSYQQMRVGIGLNVTPFINQDGLVVMKIEETIDELGEPVTIDNNPVPTTSSRTLSAEIAVRDLETIMLGGFIRNSETKSKAGVPLLKDIPLLGALFRSTGEAKERKELIVLMRPTVLRTPELAAMQVELEKDQLPGVRAAEASLEKKRSKADKNTFKQVTPFTEEEKQLYGP
jgi:type II secretory pathway component GspD/PulD (secretin)